MTQVHQRNLNWHIIGNLARTLKNPKFQVNEVHWSSILTNKVTCERKAKITLGSLNA